jgi:3-phenylpropionate/trans-cinnamate dioxygenase ferredoxin subunit
MAPVGDGAKRPRGLAESAGEIDGAWLAALMSRILAGDLSDYEDVGALDELTPGSMKGVDVDGERVLLVRRPDGTCAAIGGLCTHQVAYLEDGVLEGDTVLCPRHGAAFALTTGEPLTAPADMPVPVYDICAVAGRLLVSRKPR